ncbi:MAG: hypothetical protein JWL69_3787 [Phycisphaerales bacterium]|jgi:Stress responsive A/B Barrel Domain|nr:hypothetical protein [Phycisphaerales bacterium]
MRLLLRLLPAMLLSILAASCASPLQQASRQKGIVTHVVICWLYDRSDETALKEVTEASGKLRDIPGVLNVSVGRMLPSDRAGVDNSFDLAIVVTLADEAALQRYLKDPKHLALRKAVLERYVPTVRIYDAVSE